jgi:Domain of unknown function (DU1801)
MPGQSADGNLAGYAGAALQQLRPLRRLVLETAAATRGVGAIEESLKWGEPSYAPLKKGVGSSVRLAPRKDGKVSMNFICHTGLVAKFRELYPDTLDFEGNRTIIIDPAAPLPGQDLRHCVALALTYHLEKTRVAD